MKKMGFGQFNFYFPLLFCKIYEVFFHVKKQERGLIGQPFIIGFLAIENWPEAKLGQVDVGSNIAQDHSSNVWDVISGHYLPIFIWKVDQKCNQVKLELVWTLLKITGP